MSTDSTTPAGLLLSIDPEEQVLLKEMLEHALGEARVEAHHTDNRQYRESILHRTELMRGLIERLKGLAPA